MNITFLIGNGFDLNLGLETKYEQFIKYYQNQSHDKEDLSDHQKETLTYFKNSIKSDEALWSNAEIAVGQSTKKFKEDGKDAEDFSNCHEHFCVNLAEYLKQQEDRIRFKNYKEKLNKAFVNALKNYTAFFKETEMAGISKARNTFGGGYVYDFINFNYTSTLKSCITAVDKDSLEKRIHSGTTYQNKLGKLINVHGTLDEDMVFGVHDVNQIADPSLFEGYGDEYIGQIIKSKTNDINKHDTYNKAYEIIKNSDLIYIYGMATGETDKLWWSRICLHMYNNPNVHLIIHKFEAPKGNIVNRKLATFERQTREKFVEFSNLDKDKKAAIVNRIHIDGSNIFDGLYDLVKVSEKDAEEERAKITRLALSPVTYPNEFMNDYTGIISELTEAQKIAQEATKQFGDLYKI